MAFRQEFQVRLCALEPALAIHTTGADRGFRLNNVPARPQGIALRIKQGQHPLLLIVPHHVEPHQRRGNRHHAEKGRDELPADAGKEHHKDTRHAHQQRSTQVRLLDDQEHG